MSQVKLSVMSKHIKVMVKLYPTMDKRKIRRDAYFRYSATWKALVKRYPNSLIGAL